MKVLINHTLDRTPNGVIYEKYHNDFSGNINLFLTGMNVCPPKKEIRGDINYETLRRETYNGAVPAMLQGTTFVNYNPAVSGGIFKKGLYTDAGLRLQLDAALDQAGDKNPLLITHSLTSIPAINAALTGVYAGKKLSRGTRLVIISPVASSPKCLTNHYGLNNGKERRFGELGSLSPKWIDMLNGLQNAPEWLPAVPLYPLESQDLHDGTFEDVENEAWKASPWIHFRSGQVLSKYNTLEMISKHFKEYGKGKLAIEPLVVITEQDRICGVEDQEEIASLITRSNENIYRIKSGHRFGTGRYPQVKNLVERLEDHRKISLREVA